MKCGTSSLFDYLSQHPKIAPCKYKEPHFFSKSNNFAKGFSYYQSLWNWNYDEHKIALEATPGYTKVTHQDSANAAENIAKIQAKYDVNFKFIYIMRHPIERIKSHYVHDVAANSIENGEIKISKIEQKIVDTSKYAMQIGEFYQRFLNRDILLLNFEDLKRSPEKLLIEVCQFLDIDSTFQFQQTNVIHNSRERFRLGIPGWRNLRRTTVGKHFASKISAHQKNAIKQLIGNKKKMSVSLSDSLQQEIVAELKPDLNELHQRYNFDSKVWKIDS